MWIRSQDQEELLEVKRIRIIPVEGNDVNILAKLDRDTVILGTYHKDQAEEIRQTIWMEIGLETGFQMPKRWEDEEDFEVDFEEVKTGLGKASQFMRDFAEAAAKVKTEKEEQK